MRQWLFLVTAAAVAAALARALAPSGAGRTVVSLAAGLAVLLSAVGGLRGVEWLELEWDRIRLTGVEAAEVPVADEALKSLIAEKTGAYIVDKGRGLGMECLVEVTVFTDKSGWPTPWQIQVRGTWTPAQKEALQRAVEEEVGIPHSRQSFWEEGA